MNPVRIELISTAEAMEPLRRDWNRLLIEGSRSTVFGSWEWQSLAANVFRAGSQLAVLAAYSGDTLTAILPLRLTRTRIGGLISTHVWQCLGGGLTDYNALIIGRDNDSEIIAAFAEYLTAGGHPVDMENVLPGSPLDDLARYLSDHGWNRAVYESKVALMTELKPDYASFSKTLKKKFRKNLNNNQNYMDRTGGYTYHREPASDELLETLITLHTSRWQFKGESGALAQQRIREFHTALNRMDDRPFEIEYYTIRHRDKIVAILYTFTFEKRLYAYLSGFDMAHGRISAGNMLLNYCIEQAIGDGLEVFDMLRGDMKYKQTWATLSHDMEDALYFPPSLSGEIMFRTLRSVQAVKRILPVSMKTGIKSLLNRGKTGNPTP